jgi:hypothetical protein
MNDPFKLFNKIENLQQVNRSRWAPSRLSFGIILEKDLHGPTRVG